MLVKTEKYTDRGKELSFRPPTMEDLNGIVGLLNRCGIEQTGMPVTNRSRVLSDWTSPNFDPNASARVVEMEDGQIVGYIEIWDTDPVPATNWVSGRVHPDFEGLGIGTRLMLWAEERLLQTLDRVPQEIRVVFYAESLKNHLATGKLMEDLGMKVNRYFWRMVIDLDEKPPEPVWPAGIRMKSFTDVHDLRAVYRAFDDAFQDHWGYFEQPEEEMLEEWKHWTASDEEFNPSLWFLAMDGDEIAGLCLCRRREAGDPEMAWVNILGVRRPWRRKGLALAMLHFAFGKFYRMGKKRVGLGVDANSLTGATRLYEKAGMHVGREMLLYEKELRSGLDIRKH